MLDEKAIPNYVITALALQDLHLDPSRQEAVIEQFRLLVQMSQRFMSQPLDADEEPAPVFRL